MNKRFVSIGLACLLATQARPAQAQEFTPAQKGRVTPVVQAYRKARPAVVNIAAQQIVERGMGLFGGEDPFDQIFPAR